MQWDILPCPHIRIRLSHASLFPSLDQQHTEAETAALLIQNKVQDKPFGEPVLACLPATPWQVPAAELTRRRDLRGYRICSIDPPTARDLDDGEL
eukprot:SAG22_NODE_71_length_22540_cov_8.918052_8_plen_95_part_00